MMRLPARLTAKLAQVRIAQIFDPAPEGRLLCFVDPAEVLHTGSHAPVSKEKMQRFVATRAPVVWIGGSEPLLHAGIGHFARALARGGRFVFLETDGTSLRRRIHEFQPLPHLFLAVRLNGLQSPDSALAFEGLRAARLSGFLNAVLSIVHEAKDFAQLPHLRSFLRERDVDGWLITAGSAGEAVRRKAAEARALIPSGFWRQFSEDVEEALLSQTQDRELPHPRDSVVESPPIEAHEGGMRMA